MKIHEFIQLYEQQVPTWEDGKEGDIVVKKAGYKTRHAVLVVTWDEKARQLVITV